MMAALGMPIIESENVTEVVPLFPDKPKTKRRRRRTLGKYGRLTRRAPTAFRLGNIIVAHPEITAKLRERDAQ